VIKAVSLRDERPQQEPKVSPNGVSYEYLWKMADGCWMKDPEHRPAMSNLLPIFKDRLVGFVSR